MGSDRIRALVLAAVLSAGGPTAAHAQLDVQKQLDQIDQSFVCPEDLPTDEARKDALKLFIDRVAAAEPKITISEIVEYRVSLLKKHQCEKTLASIARQAPKGQGAADTSAHWVQAGKVGRGDGSTMTIMVDMNSMVDAGPGRMRTWVKYASSVPDGDGVSDALIYEQLDCYRRVHTTISLVRYARDGHIISNDSGDASEEQPIIPDSILAGILPFTCAAHGIRAR